MYVAEVELLLTEELRAFTPTDIHVGRINVHGCRSTISASPTARTSS